MFAALQYKRLKIKNCGKLLIMDDSVRPVSLPQCLSEKELNSFLDLIQVPVERLGENILIVYAEVGPVAWLWNEGMSQFCVRIVS